MGRLAATTIENMGHVLDCLQAVGEPLTVCEIIERAARITRNMNRWHSDFRDNCPGERHENFELLDCSVALMPNSTSGSGYTWYTAIHKVLRPMCQQEATNALRRLVEDGSVERITVPRFPGVILFGVQAADGTPPLFEEWWTKIPATPSD